MKEFDEFRFNRLEERAWQLTRELEVRGKAEAKEQSNYYRCFEQPQKALADYNEAIASEPVEGDHYFGRSIAYIALGEPEKADADINKAAELKPDKAGYYYCKFAEQIIKRTGNKCKAARCLIENVTEKRTCLK